MIRNSHLEEESSISKQSRKERTPENSEPANDEVKTDKNKTKGGGILH